MPKRERVMTMSVEQPLWRALTGYRVLTLVYAVGLFVSAYDEFERPWLAVALAGALLTFFGFMHGESIGFAQTPVVAVSYLAVAAVLYGCAKFAAYTPKPAEEEGEHGPLPAPAE